MPGARNERQVPRSTASKGRRLASGTMTTDPASAAVAATTVTRERSRHELRARRVQVAARREIVPGIVRITFTGDDLAGFEAPGPSDHVKLFFPDPTTGDLHAPTMTPEGPVRPEGVALITRDYTPFEFRDADGDAPAELDVDLVLHGSDGPASAWASRAAAGDELAVLGPRGSHFLPEGVGDATLVVDASALPAAARFARDFAAAGVPVRVLAFVSGDEQRDYPVTGADAVEWFVGPDAAETVLARLRELDFDGSSFVFLAGEAGALVPMRRHLRRELGLAAVQVQASGYWKQGVAGHDHHAPVDATDPD